MAISYSYFRQLGLQSSFVPGDGEFEDMVRGSGNTALRNEEVMRKEKCENWSELT